MLKRRTNVEGLLDEECNELDDGYDEQDDGSGGVPGTCVNYRHIRYAGM
jgi:hypothetical protein